MSDISDWQMNAIMWQSKAKELQAINMALNDEAKNLRAERDEARREICAWAAKHFKEYEEHIARKRGWDCFKEKP